MRLLFTLATLFFACLALEPAFAQIANNGTALTWAVLDPGNDWAAQAINNIFPINQNGATTVIGQIMGQLTRFVMAIAMAFLCYHFIMNIHRVAETSRLMTDAMTWMGVVRIGFAAIMMFPLASGFSNGQAMVVKTAMWGIGMAKAVYANAIQAIGPDALVIAQPMIPGTSTTVINLIQNEFCRALINQASGNPNLVPIPNPVVGEPVATLTYITWAYGLASGNETGTPVCGTVTLQQSSGATNLAGVSVDMPAIQQQILQSVLNADIRSTVPMVVQNFWQTKQASALAPLLQIFQTATADYTQQLTNTATQVTSQLRNALSDPTQARAGSIGLITNETQLNSLGWTSAGAYYLEIARLNGQTMSLLNATPMVSPPSFEGLSKSLKNDLAPLVTAETQFLSNLRSYVTTTDGLDAPTGNAQLFSGATPGGDGASAIEQVMRSIHLSDRVLSYFTEAMSPTGNNWTDPFGSLMQLGHKLIVIALTALGAAGLLSSTTGTVASTAWNILTLNFAGAAASVAGSALVQFFGTPIFLACLALLIPGLTIAFVLPMIPWVMWMAGVAGYLILVCEAVVAVPLWMLAHMTLEGAGLHGRAIEGYGLLFNLLFRPVLMLFGLFLGYTIFAAMSWLVRMSFGIAAGFVLANGWVVTNILGVCVLLSIYVTIHIVLALTSFRLITLIPHHLPRLVGFTATNRVDMNQFSKEAALVGVGGALTTMREGLREGAFGAGEAVQKQLGYTRKLTGPTTSSPEQSSSASKHGMDSTLRAATDTQNSPNEEV
ncbi:DotA/TraY family protein [Beijerinckia indica]|uniref:Conserved hypothetical membrane protein n=1 Tax=Beijerinckia indica subsp. indica (strain ATCC 9039 / DSM 1715 / NCIMB 8712) TaxID=395963 RepID=B2ILI3_BEII9|nr:DotA/TraY family protein [Beijerinckia indica]ACB97383.1 conserved hypothetical membrane protein [Beijerinckia indica subsp. indica ATCC 9039]